MPRRVWPASFGTNCMSVQNRLFLNLASRLLPMDGAARVFVLPSLRPCAPGFAL
jgi:hypothetical protein